MDTVESAGHTLIFRSVELEGVPLRGGGGFRVIVGVLNFSLILTLYSFFLSDLIPAGGWVIPFSLSVPTY